MESTRVHWLALVVGLWMTSPASILAQESTSSTASRGAVAKPAPSPVSATANGAIDLAGMEGRSVRRDPDPVKPGAKAPGDAERAQQPQEAPLTGTEAAASKATESPVLPAARAAREVGGREGRGPAIVGGKTIPKGQKPRKALQRAVPWYRGPYVVLVAVLVLIVAVSTVFKRYVPSARPLATDVLHLVGRTPLSAKQSAVLLHVGKRLVLVGVSPDSVQTLAEFTEAEEVALLMGNASAARRAAPEAFDTTLAKEFGRYDDSTSEAVEEAAADDDAMRKTQGQLQNLLSRLRALQSA